MSQDRQSQDRVPDRVSDPAGDTAAVRAGRDPGDLVVGLSPRQVVGGFAVVAALIVWLLRRARRKG
ncbi:MAG TPA: hypothetical protein VLS28_09780 [Candidatus Sulfomarinibacteraceae bacterium]|nr:hypothetical protein [Candidatus Sulfomarinibacteraceae bacterium]